MTDWAKHFRSANQTPKVDFGLFESDITNNLNAVNEYMHRVPAKTTQASTLLSDWVRWWETEGNPELSWLPPDQKLWDIARNRRLAFDLANATTPAETRAVTEQARTGMSTEQMQNQVDRRDPNTGTYYEPPPALLPPWAKPVFIGALALGLGIGFFPIVRKFILPV